MSQYNHQNGDNSVDTNVQVKRSKKEDTQPIEEQHIESAVPAIQLQETDSVNTESNTQSNNASERTMQNPWLVSNLAEYQKHTWYIASLDMGCDKVKDTWGFHSTSVSRSHSPHFDDRG